LLNRIGQQSDKFSKKRKYLEYRLLHLFKNQRNFLSNNHNVINMKKPFTSLFYGLKHVYLLVAILFATNVLYAENPAFSGDLINLSAIVNNEILDDVKPEMVIVGNTIHVVWIEYKYASEQWLYYRRSTDNGKTWENPKQLLKLSVARWDRSIEPATRFLAADGNSVHIASADHKDDKRIMLYRRSTDGGHTFESQKELIPTAGYSYWAYRNAHIKAVNGKVAIAYSGPDDNPGIRMLFSGDGGNSFTDKLVSKDFVNLSDFWYDGNQMIVMGDIRDIYLSYGRVYVSVSNNNGDAFTTSKVSRSFKDASQNDVEQCISYHHERYSAKIAKSGSNIHAVFSGVENGAWTTFYARSVNNGTSFESASDINNGALPSALLQNYMESVSASGGNVYLLYLSKQGKLFFLSSDDNGGTLSAPRSILSDKFSHIETTSFPNFAMDPSDNTGKTFYISGYNFFSIKSTDGGKTFFNSSLAAPFLLGDYSSGHSRLLIGNDGAKHWIGEVKFRKGKDKDIFYRHIGDQPQPGMINKSYLIETVVNDKPEVLIVPSTPSLNFGQSMTVEAWVKIDPSTEGKINILGKINGYDGDDIYPFFNEVSGYSMGFQKSGSKFAFHTRLVTDKGKFINSGNYDLDDNLWHHVAITYDASGGTNNFRTYFDGLLVKEQTVTGEILHGDGLLMIGSRLNYNTNSKYEVDDIRLWDRALTQEELLNNQVNKLNGTEEGLKLYLNFNDTFRDISGNGHDAIPVYEGTLVDSNFDPPVPDFEIYKSMNQISLNNKTQNGTSYQWSFGDTKTSAIANPVYSYANPGEYSITMLAKNSNSKTAVIKRVTIEGLSHVEPLKAGNKGYTSVSVHGGGLAVTGTTFLLRRSGSADIVGKNLYSPANGILSAQFLLEGAERGNWDIVVKKGTLEQVIAAGFEVTQAALADPWVSISGRGAILFNMWQTYTISFGNNGNVDAYGVPIWFAITDDPNLEIEFIDFEMVVPKLAIDKGYANDIRALGPYFTTEAVLGEAFEARVYPFMIPYIPANSSMSIRIRVKTPKSIKMMVWANPPWVDLVDEILKSSSAEGQGSKLAAAECVMGALAEGLVDIGTSAIPGVGCVWSVGKLVYQTGDAVYENKFSIWNTLWNTAVTFVDCGVNLSGVGAIYKGVGVFLANQAGYAKSIKECNELAKSNSKQVMSVGAVSSFDPNEMIGPAGFGDQRWIQKNSTIPYTILFENISTATAPAHIVTIIDTLDTEVFDIRNFGFSSFGWGDTVLVPKGNTLKEFSMDVDLRPVMQLITRVSGKLDTLTGVVRWEFLSLNPSTMDIEEDPFIGFLPPNNANHAGEGFVSFFVGVRNSLATNDVLKNMAYIVFDANAPIITNEFINTLDTDKPVSQVLPLEATSKDYFTVSWIGTDKGSGIGRYAIYVLENDTLLRPWKLSTSEISATFVGEVGSNYKFYSIAIDNVSLEENDPGDYDAFTTVTVNVKEFEMKKADLMVYPNPVTDRLSVSFPNAPCGAYVVEIRSITGQIHFSEIHDDYALSNGLSINMKGLNSGHYFIRVVYGNSSITRLVIVK
jgi:PKD repeat protein